MTLAEAVGTCFRKYVTFSGRAPRSEFWKFALFLILVQIALTAVNSMIFGPELLVEETTVLHADGSTEQSAATIRQYSGGVFGNLFALATLLPQLAVTWRRMHDIGSPGWRVFLPLGVWIVVVALSAIWVVGPSAIIDVLQSGQSVQVQGPGFLFVLLLFGLLGALALTIVWLASRSQPGANRYGPNPIEVTP